MLSRTKLELQVGVIEKGNSTNTKPVHINLMSGASNVGHELSFSFGKTTERLDFSQTFASVGMAYNASAYKIYPNTPYLYSGSLSWGYNFLKQESAATVDTTSINLTYKDTLPIGDPSRIKFGYVGAVQMNKSTISGDQTYKTVLDNNSQIEVYDGRTGSKEEPFVIKSVKLFEKDQPLLEKLNPNYNISTNKINAYAGLNMQTVGEVNVSAFAGAIMNAGGNAPFSVKPAASVRINYDISEQLSVGVSSYVVMGSKSQKPFSEEALLNNLSSLQKNYYSMASDKWDALVKEYITLADNLNKAQAQNPGQPQVSRINSPQYFVGSAREIHDMTAATDKRFTPEIGGSAHLHYQPTSRIGIDVSFGIATKTSYGSKQTGNTNNDPRSYDLTDNDITKQGTYLGNHVTRFGQEIGHSMAGNIKLTYNLERKRSQLDCPVFTSNDGNSEQTISANNPFRNLLKEGEFVQSLNLGTKVSETYHAPKNPGVEGIAEKLNIKGFSGQIAKN